MDTSARPPRLLGRIAAGAAVVALVLLLRGLGIGWLLLTAAAVAGGLAVVQSARVRNPALLPALSGTRGAVAVVAAVHVVVAGVLWLPGWRRTWNAAWLPVAGTSAQAPAAGDAAQVSAQTQPSARNFQRLGEAQLSAHQAAGPPVALDTALYLGGSGAALDADLGRWYAAGGGGPQEMTAWWFFAQAEARRPQDGAYAAAAQQAQAAATAALRLGSWAQH